MAENDLVVERHSGRLHLLQLRDGRRVRAIKGWRLGEEETATVTQQAGQQCGIRSLVELSRDFNEYMQTATFCTLRARACNSCPDRVHKVRALRECQQRPKHWERSGRLLD